VYDPKTEPREFLGLSKGEAVAKACRFFACDESELELAELDSKRVFGLATRVGIVARTVGARRAPREREREREHRRREPEPEISVEPTRDSFARSRESLLQQQADPEIEKFEGGPSSELSPVGEFVRGVVARMGLGDFRISEEADEGVLVISLQGPAVRQIVDFDRRAIEGIKILAGQAALQQEGDAPRRIVIDVESDPDEKEQFLTRLAERAARRATEARRSVALDPMNSRDRRLIHVALRNERRVATMSVGSGRYRQVVVVPDSAPEWEEASQYRKASESNSQFDD